MLMSEQAKLSVLATRREPTHWSHSADLSLSGSVTQFVRALASRRVTRQHASALS